MTETTIDTFIEPGDLAEDTRFTEASLNGDLMRQAGLVAHYGVAVGKAQAQMDNMKHRLEIQTAISAKKMRDEAAEEGKKITEKQIELDLSLDRGVIKARRNYNEAKAIFETVKVGLEALRHKKDAMIQIGVSRRMEIEHTGRTIKSSEAVTAGNREARDEIAERVANIGRGN